jgi:hypothetical protein
VVRALVLEDLVADGAAGEGRADEHVVGSEGHELGVWVARRGHRGVGVLAEFSCDIGEAGRLEQRERAAIGGAADGLGHEPHEGFAEERRDSGDAADVLAEIPASAPGAGGDSGQVEPWPRD